MSDIKRYRQWAKSHPNFITPDIVSIKRRNNRFIEISEGDTSGLHGKPKGSEKLYGVSEFEEKDGKFYPTSRGKPFKSRKEAESYANTLSNSKRKANKIM